MEVVDFKKEHFDYLIAHGVTDKKLKPFLHPEDGAEIEKAQDTYTLLDEDKNPIVIGGIRPFWFNRGEAWVIFSNTLKREQFVEVHRVVQKFIDCSPLKRIEMVVDQENVYGHKWARLLGFEKEAECMKCYRADGGNTTLYARIKDAS